MSLYNMLFGENPHSDTLLSFLGLTTADVPRYRDCWVEGDKIVIHTRTGGGNRDYYENMERCKNNYPEYFGKEDEPNGPWNDDLEANEYYLYNEDSDGDSTYANFYFEIPPQFHEATKDIPQDLSAEQKWSLIFQILENSK